MEVYHGNRSQSPLATLNRKHFECIEGLILVDGEEKTKS